MQNEAKTRKRQGNRVVLAPTMGFLHEGHLALIREGRRRGDVLVVSIFVNPVQFGPNEDYEQYPRDFEKDREMVQKEGADILFAPEPFEMYPEGFGTSVNVDSLSRCLCGISRPGHFQGVATVLVKLFNIVKPDVAVFGEKDYQQLLIVRRLAADLNFDMEIVGFPTVREEDGLALSSRNSYLTKDERVSAQSICQSLKKAQILVDCGINDSETIIKSATEIIGSRPEAKIDYISLCDPVTLQEVKTIDRPVLLAIAVKIGKTRLIDNMLLHP
jgi:pantoate--beta-alanine ligase